MVVDILIKLKNRLRCYEDNWIASKKNLDWKMIWCPDMHAHDDVASLLCVRNLYGTKGLCSSLLQQAEHDTFEGEIFYIFFAYRSK